MKIYKRLVSFLLLFCLVATAFSQVTEIPTALANKLAGKRKYVDVMKEVDNYYRANNFNANPKLFKEYKRWNRWAWFAARHVNGQGEVDYKTSKYFDEAQKISGSDVANSPNATTSTAGNWTSVGPLTTGWGTNSGSRGIGRIDRLAMLPGNASVMLAGSPSGGLWRTDNGGNNWYSITKYLPNCGIAGVVFGNNDPSGNTIYILTGQKVAGNFLADYGLHRNGVGVLVTTNGGTNWKKLGNSETVLRNRVPQKLMQLRNFPNVFFAATLNGLYASFNFGETWAAVPGGNTVVTDIEQHPTNDAILYFTTPSFVYKSINFGQSFFTTNTYTPNPNPSTYGLLAVTPANPDEVYFLQCGNDPVPNPNSIVSNTIYKSVNSGDHFTRINTQNVIASGAWYNQAFAVHPTNNNNMVAAGFSLSSSTNNGNELSFGNTTQGFGNGTPTAANYLHSDIHDLMYSPNGALLYAACDGGVFVSNNNGVTWTDKSVGLQCSQYYHMEGFEGTANLLVGGLQDNGTHYTTTGNHMIYSGEGDGFVSDFVNTNNNFFFQVENTSISRFTRSSNTSTPVSPGFGPTRTFFPDIACHPTNGNIVYVGYRDTIWRSLNQGSSWAAVRLGGTNDGTATTNRGYNGGFAVSAQQPDRIYAASGNGVIRSDNQGGAWTVISGTTGWPAAFGTITDIATSSGNANEIWLTTTGNNGASRVMYSGNAGASWFDFTGSLPNVPVYSIFCTSQGDVYCGTELGVYFMDFTMSDWVPFYNGLPMIPVTDLFVDEANNTISAATWGRGIWRSDLYSDCSPLVILGSNVNGRFTYQSSGVLESTQKMQGNYENDLRYRSAGKISLKNGFMAKDGSYFKSVIGPCGQGVFKATNGVTTPSKAEILHLIPE
ncbi:MAG: hypothetical protein V4722_19885 [Bacteroidota bacterium]